MKLFIDIYCDYETITINTSALIFICCAQGAPPSNIINIISLFTVRFHLFPPCNVLISSTSLCKYSFPQSESYLIDVSILFSVWLLFSTTFILILSRVQLLSILTSLWLFWLFQPAPFFAYDEFHNILLSSSCNAFLELKLRTTFL